MKIALFGGAFNPIHLAHIRLAEYAKAECSIDKVLFMPTYDSPHKSTTKAVPYKDRMEMCRLAVKDNDDFIVSDVESTIKGKSYSYVTLEKLKNIYPNDKLYLIIGADMYLSLLNWKNPERIFQLSDIITCPRDNGDYNSILEYSKHLKSFGCCSHILKEPIMDLSSTLIRNNLSKYYELGLVDKKVYDYAVKHNLYEVK
jgi:nicotinate-nucleotide adenylyltransferase